MGEVLFARTDEEEPAGTAPEVAVVAAQPTLIATALDAEDAGTAARIGDRLHPDEETFALGLVGVLQTHLWTDLREAELETQALCLHDDVASIRAVLEAELVYGDVHEVDLALLLARREGTLVEDVVAPVADPYTGILDGVTEVFGGLETCSELDRLPDSERGRGRSGEHELSAEEAIDTIFATELVPHGFDATERNVRILHTASFPTISRRFL